MSRWLRELIPPDKAHVVVQSSLLPGPWGKLKFVPHRAAYLGAALSAATVAPGEVVIKGGAEPPQVKSWSARAGDKALSELTVHELYWLFIGMAATADAGIAQDALSPSPSLQGAVMDARGWALFWFALYAILWNIARDKHQK